MSVKSNDDREQGSDSWRVRSVALTSMRMALALLDRVGEGIPAARLQGAIDALAANLPVEPPFIGNDCTGMTRS